MDYIVHGVTKSRTQLSHFHFHFQLYYSFATRTENLSIILTVIKKA